MSLDIGQVLGGRFLIERLVGRGTMGCVFQARDQSNNQRIAIRLIQPDFDNEQVAAFSESEARIAGQLSSKHIAKLANIGFLPTGERCILSEYIDGETLKNRILRQGPLPELHVAQMLIQLLEGLAAAHEAGVIHRDLTPRSVFLVPGAADSGALAQIIDFGISRLQALTGNQSAAQAAGIDTATLQCLSPEQLNGLREIDPRSNIYSLGVIAYEAITGRLPFEGQDFSDPTLALLQEEPTPVEELAPESSSPFASLIRKGMARSPNARFQYADEMIAAITNWANRAGISQAQLAAGIGGVQNRSAVALIAQEPTSDISASSARQVPSVYPAAAVPASAPPLAAAAPVYAPPPAAAVPASTPPPAAAFISAPPPVSAVISAPPPVSAVISAPPPAAAAPVYVPPPASAVIAAPLAPEPIATLPMPDVIAAPPPVSAPAPLEAAHAADIDQSLVDAMFAPPPVAPRDELPFANMDDLAPHEMPPVAHGSSPVASLDRVGALIAPTMSAQTWQAPPETPIARSVLQPPPYDPIDASSAAPQWAAPAPQISPDLAQPSPEVTTQDRPAPAATQQMPPLATLEPAIAVSALAPAAASPFETAATPAYGTQAVQPELAPAPQQALVPESPAAAGPAAEQPFRGARTILGIGGIAGLASPSAQAEAPATLPVEGAQSGVQRPEQATAPGLHPSAGSEGQAPPQAQPVAAVASVPQQQQVAQLAAEQAAPSAAPPPAAVAPTPAAIAPQVFPSPYDSPYGGAPQRSRKPLVIAALLVGIVGVGVAIAMSQGKSEPDPKTTAASQAVVPPRPIETLQTDSVAAQASAAARAEASSKEASSAGSKSGPSLSQAMNAGLLSQSVAAAQKSSKPAAPAPKPAAPASKPAAPAPKPAAPASKPTPAATPPPNKPAAAKPAPGANPYNYR